MYKIKGEPVMLHICISLNMNMILISDDFVRWLVNLTKYIEKHFY